MTAPRLSPVYGSPEYRQLWRLIDGAVRSCFEAHPDYLADAKRERTVRNSIVKRVTGAVLSYAEEVADSSSKVRSRFSLADEMATASVGRYADGSLDHEPGAVAVTSRPSLPEASL